MHVQNLGFIQKTTKMHWYENTVPLSNTAKSWIFHWALALAIVLNYQINTGSCIGYTIARDKLWVPRQLSILRSLHDYRETIVQ